MASSSRSTSGLTRRKTTSDGGTTGSRRSGGRPPARKRSGWRTSSSWRGPADSRRGRRNAMPLYRLLLFLCPASFRHEYGGEMCRIFARRRRDAEGVIALAALWISAIGDVIGTASRVHIDILRQDLRHTGRALSRAPGFTATAVLVTALGVGATTAAFTLTDHVLLRPLPFRDPDRLVKIWEGAANRNPSLRGIAGTTDVSPANFRS